MSLTETTYLVVGASFALYVFIAYPLTCRVDSGVLRRREGHPSRG
jgi:hypothetical protein